MKEKGEVRIALLYAGTLTAGCSPVVRATLPARMSRNCVGDTFRLSLPCRATETMAVSSETTITIASVSSLKPSAARCRVPSVRS
jgi:hypothetical protein